MSIEELFLRQIDSVDGNIEVIVHPGQPMTCVSTGPFVWQVENVDRDHVIQGIARVMSEPGAAAGIPVDMRLDSGEVLHIGVQNLRNGDGDAYDTLLWLVSGAAHLRLHLSTASLLVAALSEARQWQRNQLLAAGTEASPC